MHDAIEFLNARGAIAFGRKRRSKRHFGQLRAIHTPVAIEDIPPKMPYYLVVDSLARLHQ
jgi:hypothetical protein